MFIIGWHQQDLGFVVRWEFLGQCAAGDRWLMFLLAISGSHTTHCKNPQLPAGASDLQLLTPSPEALLHCVG